MQTTLLIAAYLFVTAILQALGFALSRAVDYIDPSWSLLMFLLMFLGAFWLAWPIAVWLTEPKNLNAWLRRR